MELFKENAGTWEEKVESNPIRRQDKFDVLKDDLVHKLSSISPDHKVSKYVRSRLIPVDQYWRLYYSPRFFSWINRFIPEKFSDDRDEGRLVLPMVDTTGYVFGVQGRSLDPKSSLRYVTIMFDETKPKIFGLDQVNFHQKIYVLEGPIDSLFIPNSIAMAGINSSINVINNFTIVLDNEPRNKELVNRMDKYIHDGYSICIWPDYLLEKDINDMVLSGKSPTDIIKIIEDNTYRELKARVRLNSWKKI